MWQLLLHSPKCELRVNKFNIWHNLAHSSNKKYKSKAVHNCQIPSTFEFSIKFVAKKSIWSSSSRILPRQPDEMLVVSAFFYRSTPPSPPPCLATHSLGSKRTCSANGKIKQFGVKRMMWSSPRGNQFHYFLAKINRLAAWLSEQSVSLDSRGSLKRGRGRARKVGSSW